MHDRYLGYRERREPLASMVYFCLTALELPWGPGRGAREPAASHYGVDETVLNALWELGSTKGGVGARKAQGVPLEYTREETRFLEEAVKAIIRRSAEVAHDPNARRPPSRCQTCLRSSFATLQGHDASFRTSHGRARRLLRSVKPTPGAATAIATNREARSEGLRGSGTRPAGFRLTPAHPRKRRTPGR